MSAMEWIGFITGVICVFLIVIEKDINWPIGVLNSVALAYVFWGYALYAQVGLQIFYIIECLYGWYLWTRRDRATGVKLLRIGRTGRTTSAWLTGITVVCTGILFWIFKRTSDPAPFWDSVISATSLVAEYMLCLKLTEGWMVYFAADLISLVVLGVLHQWVTFATYLCFTLLCALGIREWLKRLAQA